MPTEHRYPKLWLAGRAVSIGARMVHSRVRPSPARTAADVPGTGAEFTVEWLTAVLCRDVPGAEVTAFSTPGGSSGTSERVALRVTYNRAGRDAGLPENLFAKLSSSYAQRLMLGGAQVIKGEADFYMRFRPRVDMEAPKGYWGISDDRGWTFVVLMDDIARDLGATFPELTIRFTRAQVEDLLQNMARYHGAFWEDPELSILKTPTDHVYNLGSFVNMQRRCAVGMERAKAVISPGVYGQADRLWRGTLRSVALNTDTHPRTLLHGDSHSGQLYITGDGRMGLTDWQACMQGGWGFDYAYLVGTTCEPEDRREWDRELLEYYLEHLVAHGGKPPAFDEAWLMYRQQLFYPYSAWAFTIGRAAYQPEMQPTDRCLAALRRLTAAIDENKSFEALGV